MVSTGTLALMAWNTDALFVLCALNLASTPLEESTDTVQRSMLLPASKPILR